jgi:hypothetical protein
MPGRLHLYVPFLPEIGGAEKASSFIVEFNSLRPRFP